MTDRGCRPANIAAGRIGSRSSSLTLSRFAPGLRYANLAVRSRLIEDVVADQIPRAIELRADLVSILAGGNDLARLGANPRALAVRLGEGVRLLRESGAEVLLVTPFLPRRRASVVLAGGSRRSTRSCAPWHAKAGALLLDLEAVPPIADLSLWANDAVHLNSRGHRFLAYEAAERLGVPDAGALGRLEQALHFDEPEDAPTRLSRAEWLRDHALPWAVRRLRGRTAGDGREPKHSGLVAIRGGAGALADM